MTTAGAPTPMETGDEERDDSPQMQCAPPPHPTYPLPGVLDFLGASVGGELAEEQWR